MAVVDLSHVLSPSTPLFPVYDPVKVADKFRLAADGFNVRSWAFDEHSGTHVDAPSHFADDAPSVDRLDPEDLVLPLAVLDLRDRAARDEDLEVGPDDVLAWEREHGPLPQRCAVLVDTGWAARIDEPGAFINVDESGTLHSPGLGADVCEFLIAERPGVRAVGMDTGSLDIGPSADFAAHVAWLPTGRYGLECVANLDRVPRAGATLVVGVIPFEAGSGGPARVLALT
ncbi:MAG: cyclase family protein [Solirubrobacteraceae bacterium]